MLIAKRFKPAFISLISVLILGAIGLSISIYIVLLSLASSKTSFSMSLSSQARMLANNCAEIALEVIRDNNSFTGVGTSSSPIGTCSYTVANTGGETRTIGVAATSSSVVRKLSITVTAINPAIITGSWQETP